MRDLRKALELIEEHDGDFDGPKPASLVARAETALGLVFPPTYREFLLRLGVGDIAGVEFFGVVGEDFENSSVPDSIWLTLNERKNSKLHQELILVADTGDGHYYAIDTSKPNKAGEGIVVEWSPQNGQVEKVAADFGAFMLQRIREAVEE